MLTTANCRFVVKSLLVASWKSIAKAVIVWEHYGIRVSSHHLQRTDNQCHQNYILAQTWESCYSLPRFMAFGLPLLSKIEQREAHVWL